jgi:putative membrane-bound dehydrogenase-like protein
MFVILAVAATLATADRSGAAEPVERARVDSLEINYGDQLPRIAATEPDDALATFEVHEGFHIEPVATEPLVADPVAAAFDENGRLFVVEMRGYSEERDENLSRIRMLEDRDGDGRYDHASVLAEGLLWPTAITCYDGGVFVADAPDLYYFKDTDGDGKADVSRKVITGFSVSNVQGLVNSLHWGLDGWIHGATSTSGGALRRADEPDATPLDVRGRDFAFHPQTLEIRATSGGAQHGMSRDDWGRKFCSSNSDHIQLVMYEDRYLARNPRLAAPGPRKSIAADGPQAEVFRISPSEPWRVVRTRLRVQQLVPGPVEGGGRAAGYFTGATGVTIYRGDAWPKAYHGNAIVGDVGSNIVHRKVLTPNGVELIADRADPGREFFASRDTWFRPCQFLNTPDGTLCVLDVYREVIEHPASLPPIIKQHLDLTSGRDRGRIWRIAPDGFKQPTPPRLGEMTTAELVATLAHTNGWHRDTALRLLTERQDTSAIALLRTLATESDSALGRMYAAHALANQDSLSVDDALVAMNDAHSGVRRHGVRLGEAMLADSQSLRTQLTQMADDDDLMVRYQVAFSLGEMPGASASAALAKIARRDSADRWMRMAVMSSLASGAGEVFADAIDDESFRRSASGQQMLGDLLAQIAAEGGETEAARLLADVAALGGEDRGLFGALLRRMAGGNTGKVRSIVQLAGAEASFAELIDTARANATDAAADTSVRVSAIEVLPMARWDDVDDVWTELVDGEQPIELQRAALQALGRFGDPAVGDIVIDAWPTLGPRLRRAAAEVLFARVDRLLVLFEAIEAGDIDATEIDPQRIEQLADHANKDVSQRAMRIAASIAPPDRTALIETYRPALTMAASSARGREVFKKICAACHKLDGVGHEIGPNLATVKNRGPEAIMVNVLDPNREANPQFVNYVCVTDDGRTFSGMITAETSTSVTLGRAEGASDTVLRANIEELRSSGKSIMPDGMEKEISVQQMADLMAYLTNTQ